MFFTSMEGEIFMKRTKLRDRLLPNYTRGEEVFHMVSHIVGGAIGIVICALCVIKAFRLGGAYEIVAAFLYGISMIALYTMSSLYHGLKEGTAKRVFQVLDHCTIFLLIAGTYTPDSGKVYLDGKDIAYKHGDILKTAGKYKVVATDECGNFNEYTFEIEKTISGANIALIAIGGVALVGGIVFFVLKKKKVF